tara:strand:+ start:1012 stop:1176 length:165 start_codon:yes stop_codon:yes gene_type:complete
MINTTYENEGTTLTCIMKNPNNNEYVFEYGESKNWTVLSEELLMEFGYKVVEND